MKDRTRLTWGGSITAQREADKAFQNLKPKKRQTKKRRQDQAKQNQPASKKKPRVPKPFVRRKQETWQEFYLRYMRSSAWKATREYMFEQRGRACELCGTVERLQVHHVDYSRLGREELEDCKVLCRDCHDDAHGQEYVNDDLSKRFQRIVGSL